MWLAAGVNVAITAESVSELQGVLTWLLTSSLFRKTVRGDSFLESDRTSAFFNIRPPTSGCLRGMAGQGPRVPDRVESPWPRNPGIDPRPRRSPDRGQPGHGPAASVRHRGGTAHDRVLTAALCAWPGLDRGRSSSQTGRQRLAGGLRPAGPGTRHIGGDRDDTAGYRV